MSDREHARVTSPQRSQAYLFCVLPHGFRNKPRETVCSLDQFYWLYWNNENDQETVGHGVSLRSSRFLFFSRRRSNKRAKKHACGVQKIGEKLGGGEREGGGYGEKRNRVSSARLTPSLCSLFFAPLSVWFPLRKFLKAPAQLVPRVWTHQL